MSAKLMKEKKKAKLNQISSSQTGNKIVTLKEMPHWDVLLCVEEGEGAQRGCSLPTAVTGTT